MADCPQDPNECRALPPECPTTTAPATKCNGDRTNNVWIDGGNPETGEGGVCLLDTLQECQVIWIIERDERARADLLRVTDDERLLELGNTIARLPTINSSDAQMKGQNSYVPFYSVFKGQPPFAQ